MKLLRFIVDDIFYDLTRERDRRRENLVKEHFGRFDVCPWANVRETKIMKLLRYIVRDAAVANSRVREKDLAAADQFVPWRKEYEKEENKVQDQWSREAFEREWAKKEHDQKIERARELLKDIWKREKKSDCYNPWTEEMVKEAEELNKRLRKDMLKEGCTTMDEYDEKMKRKKYH